MCVKFEYNQFSVFFGLLHSYHLYDVWQAATWNHDILRSLGYGDVIIMVEREKLIKTECRFLISSYSSLKTSHAGFLSMTMLFKSCWLQLLWDIKITSHGRKGDSRLQLSDHLFNSLCRLTPSWTKHQRLAFMIICYGNIPVTDTFPLQRDSSTKGVSMSWNFESQRTKGSVISWCIGVPPGNSSEICDPFY